MPNLKRRQFLQFAGAIATSVGLSQANVMRQGDRYARVLAQGTPRKLALLVGINNYAPSQIGWGALRGCVTDVQMQRQVLVHRFGFNPNDIVTVTDEAATRDGIITAFQEHLIAQARAGDVVVFHYSGHGSQVVDSAPYRDETPLNSTFVPIDSPLPDGYQTAGGNVNDIMGKTLFLLMSQLQTEQVTAVLDSCHSGGGKRGAVTFRSRDGAGSSDSRLYSSEAERELQQQIQADLGWSDEEVYELRKAGVAKGVVIASAAENQLAADAYFNGFYAGAFTYLLTQYLWQQTGDRALTRTFVDIDRATRSLGTNRNNVQNPEFETNLPANLENAPLYFTEMESPPAEAIALSSAGDRIQLWLGGIHPDGLRAFQEGAVFSAVNGDGSAVGTVQLVANPEGLNAEGRLLRASQDNISRGNISRESADDVLFLQEQIRTVPDDLSLKIGVDESILDEQEGVRQAIAPLNRLQAQPPESDDVDYFLGRFRAGQSPFVAGSLSELPPNDSIVLLYPDLSIVPNSWGASAESAVAAVDRLQSRFRTLLSTRIIRSIVNPGSSDLRVEASVNVVGTTASAAATQISVRGGSRGLEQDGSEVSSALLTDIPADASRLPLGSLIEIQVTNNDTRQLGEVRGLYVAVLVIDSSGDMTVLYPTDWTAPDLAAFVESGQTIRIPDPDRGDRFRLRISPPLGVTEVLVIASAVPLRRTLTALSAIAQGQEQAQGTSTRGLPLSTPRGEEFVEVAENLLDDLDTGTRGIALETVEPPANVRGVSGRQLTALSLAFEVYDPATAE
ncbi:MAG: caspase family protein [Elainellaceae cyanobacterium]